MSFHWMFSLFITLSLFDAKWMFFLSECSMNFSLSFFPSCFQNPPTKCVAEYFHFLVIVRSEYFSSLRSLDKDDLSKSSVHHGLIYIILNHSLVDIVRVHLISCYPVSFSLCEHERVCESVFLDFLSQENVISYTTCLKEDLLCRHQGWLTTYPIIFQLCEVPTGLVLWTFWHLPSSSPFCLCIILVMPLRSSVLSVPTMSGPSDEG